MIPASRLSPQGLALLRTFPSPNALIGSNNYIQARSRLDNQRKDTLSVDFLPAERHYFRFRWQNYNLYHEDAFRGNLDLAPSALDRPNDTASLNYIWTVTPTIINEALVTASADRVRIAVQTQGGRYQRSTYGINYPYLFQAKEIFDKIPTINIQQFQEVDGGPYPSSSAGPIYNLSDNLSWINGNHTFKFGVLFERSGQNDFDQINVQGVPGGTNNQNGRFEFRDSRPGGSGTAIANAALGLFNNYAELGNRSYTPYRGHMWEWFAQDSWKATQKLRLEYGVRWSRIQPYYSLWRICLFSTRHPMIHLAPQFLTGAPDSSCRVISTMAWSSRVRDSRTKRRDACPLPIPASSTGCSKVRRNTRRSTTFGSHDWVLRTSCRTNR